MVIPQKPQDGSMYGASRGPKPGTRFTTAIGADGAAGAQSGTTCESRRPGNLSSKYLQDMGQIR